MLSTNLDCLPSNDPVQDAWDRCQDALKKSATANCKGVCK